MNTTDEFTLELSRDAEALRKARDYVASLSDPDIYDRLIQNKAVPSWCSDIQIVEGDQYVVIANKSKLWTGGSRPKIGTNIWWSNADDVEDKTADFAQFTVLDAEALKKLKSAA